MWLLTTENNESKLVNIESIFEIAYDPTRNALIGKSSYDVDDVVIATPVAPDKAEQFIKYLSIVIRDESANMVDVREYFVTHP